MWALYILSHLIQKLTLHYHPYFTAQKNILRVCWIFTLSIVLIRFFITPFLTGLWVRDGHRFVQYWGRQKWGEGRATAFWRISGSHMVTDRNRNAQQVLAYSSFPPFHIQLLFQNADSADQQWPCHQQLLGRRTTEVASSYKHLYEVPFQQLDLPGLLITRTPENQLVTSQISCNSSPGSSFYRYPLFQK